MNKLTKQDYYQKVLKHAEKNGGKCLSIEYVSAKTKLIWQCKANHVWESDYDHSVNRNRWCQKCFYDKAIIEDGYEQAMSYAKSKGGFVIIPKDNIIKSKTYLIWKCNNHEHKEWSGEFRNVVKLKTWCPYCAGRFSKEEYLQKAKDYAISKGGICLSDSYKDQNTKLIFKCSELNHKIFTAKIDRLVQFNRWCKECKPNTKEEIKKRESYLQKAKAHAIAKGGECLSDKYTSSSKKLKWQCSEKHKPWLATYQNVVGTLKRWCPECAGQFTPSEQLQRAKDYAKSKDGQCLSTEYLPDKKLLWKCREISHSPWEAMFSNIITSKNKTWCPECGSSIYYKENNTRIILEKLLGFSLSKTNASWNINPITGKILELDGYNEQKKFAFEFQGRHHFEENVFKNCNLADVQLRDKIKADNCLNNKVYLLLINDKKHMGALKEHIDYIKGILEENKIKYLNIDNNLIIEEIETFSKISDKDEKLKKAKEYAISRGGMCLSKSYINSREKLIWKCEDKSHPIWHAGIYILSKNSWCPYCAGKYSKEYFLNSVKEYAISKGGLCLSEKYKNNSTPMLWKCKNNHEWENPASYVIGKKRWCQKCKK